MDSMKICEYKMVRHFQIFLLASGPCGEKALKEIEDFPPYKYYDGAHKSLMESASWDRREEEYTILPVYRVEEVVKDVDKEVVNYDE
jgi:hypothetical protein